MSVPTSVDRPSAVQTAWVAWLVFLGLVALTMIVTLVVSDGPKSASAISILIITIIGGCINKFREGANWARIVLTVIGTLNVLANLGTTALAIGSGFASEVPAISFVLAIVGPLGAIVAISLSYRREANEYFAAVKAAHA